MTEPAYEAGGPVARPGDGGGFAGAFGPEAVAAVLSIIVVVALLASRLAFSGGTATVSPTPSGPASSPATPNPEARLQVVVGTLIQINATLTRQQSALESYLETTPYPIGRVKPTIIAIWNQMPQAKALAAELAATPQGGVLGVQLGAVYAELERTAESARLVPTRSAADYATYKTNSRTLIAIIKQLEPLDQRLRLLLTGLPDPGGSAPPSGEPSVAPTEPPSASAPPTATLAPTPTAPPVTPPPSTPPGSPPASALPTPTPGPNPIVNPGFEEGVGAPWALVLDGPAQAKPTADSQQPHSGKLSARIDISVPSTSPGWISLRQGGLTIQASANYSVTVYARSAAPRQIRIRIIGPEGQTLGNGSQPFTIGPTWAVLTFTMSSIFPTNAGSIAIDVGGSGETVWIDDVSVSQVP